MNNYELVVLYHPDLEIDLDKALNKVESLIKDVKGKITFTESWGKRRLAYQIQNQDYAIYVYYEIQLPVDGLKTLEAQFNMTDELIRYLITKPTPNFGDRDKKVLEDTDKKAPDGDEDEKTTKDTKTKTKQTKQVEDKQQPPTGEKEK